MLVQVPAAVTASADWNLLSFQTMKSWPSVMPSALKSPEAPGGRRAELIRIPHDEVLPIDDAIQISVTVEV